MEIKNPFGKTLSIEDAQELFNEKSEAFTKALAQYEDANGTLEVAHAESAPSDRLIKAEDALTKATVLLKRTERARDVALVKMENAKQAQGEKASKKLIKQRDAVLKRRLVLAKQLDEMVNPLAATLKEFQEIDLTIRKLTNQGVVSPNARGTYGKTATFSMINQMLFRAGVPGISKLFMSKPNRENMKSLVDQVKNSNKTILLIDEQPLVIKQQPASEVTAAPVIEESANFVNHNPVDTQVVEPRQEVDDGALAYGKPAGSPSRFL